MQQLTAQLSNRAARGLAGLVLVGLPLLVYLLPIAETTVESTGLFSQHSDIYMAGQALEPASARVEWTQLMRLPVALGLVLTQAGPALLLGGTFTSTGLGLGWWLVRQRWPQWQLRRPATLAGAAGRWLALLALAYALGGLAHRLLPPGWFNPPRLPAGLSGLQALVTREEYLWPLARPGVVLTGGWTIYAPLPANVFAFQPLKASALKLTALLATLWWHRRLTRPAATPVSA